VGRIAEQAERLACADRVSDLTIRSDKTLKSFTEAANQYLELGLPYERFMATMTFNGPALLKRNEDRYPPNFRLSRYEAGDGLFEQRPQPPERKPRVDELWKGTPPVSYPEPLLR
jgi:hypothetical protein